MRITPAYEDLLAAFARDYPGFFWQLNFWGAAGSIATALALAEALLGPAFGLHSPWARLAAYLVPATLLASLIQRRYRRRAPAPPSAGAPAA